MPYYLRIKPQGERVASLSSAVAALARAEAVQNLKKPPRLLRWAVQRSSKFKETPLLEAELFLVDYGALEGFERYAVRAAGRTALLANAQGLRGKAVLVGDGSLQHHDLHIVPNRRYPVPGVFIQASAAWTLMHAPIYELTPLGRITVDFVLASVIVCVTYWCSALFSRGRSELSEHNEDNEHKTEHQIERKVSWWVCGLTFMVGVVLVHRTRVMWDDFLFVIVGLLVLHGCLKKTFVRVWNGIHYFTARISCKSDKS
jgi:hypothetical protein